MLMPSPDIWAVTENRHQAKMRAMLRKGSLWCKMRSIEGLSEASLCSLGVVVSQGFGAPSWAVLGPKGVVELVVAGACRSQGFAGAGRPAGSV